MTQDRKRTGRAALALLLWGGCSLLLGVFWPGGTRADDLYPEIHSPKEVIVGDVIYLWATLPHGCGQTPSCSGSCTFFAGVFFQQVATCTRLCAEIPAGRKVKQHEGQDRVQVSARNSREGEYLDCKEGGGPRDSGVCPIGSAAWEGSEYSPETQRYCVKIKNWDAARARDFSVSIELE